MPTYDDVLLTYDDPDNTYEGGGGEGYEWSEPVTATTQLGPGSDTLPSLFVEADFESLPFELPTEWTDLPTFRSVSIRQGRQRLPRSHRGRPGHAWCWTTGNATTTRRCTRRSDRRTT